MSNVIENVKKILGVVWILLGLYIGYNRIMDGYNKIISASASDQIFGWIMLLVLTPIMVFSLVAFGVLSLNGEYSRD